MLISNALSKGLDFLQKYRIIHVNMKDTIKVKLEVLPTRAAAERYRIASLNGALTIQDGSKHQSPGEYIGTSTAEALTRSSRYDVTVVPQRK